jgi:hypothetical protein
MKTWTYEQTGSDGKLYNLRILCTEQEKAQLKRVGILPDDVREIVGMQRETDARIAVLERSLKHWNIG